MRDELLNRLGPTPVYRTEKDPAALLPNLSAITTLADSEREALGFLPPAAYQDAIQKRRLIAMFSSVDGESDLAGFVLYSGVFPNARIQQVVVAKQHRRAHVATALLNEVVSQLETWGYLTVTAAVASDLPIAQSFYEQNGFVAKRSYKGGRARNRKIVLRARILQTPSLFSDLEPKSALSQCAVDLGLRRRSNGQAPLYAIDLNVLFDVTKEPPRPRAPLANKLIAAALAHRVRLAIAPEFIVELKRQIKGNAIDPVLCFALQLPRLPKLDSAETDRLASYIHTIVFERPGLPAAGTPQSLSDARHLAEATLARASAYLTSDGSILAARADILRQIGIDVADLEEFVELLPVDSHPPNPVHLQGTDLASKEAPIETIRHYLQANELPQTLRTVFLPVDDVPADRFGRAVFEGNDVVAASVYIVPRRIHAPARVLVHVRADHVAADILADHLLDVACRDATSGGPITIELANVAGQTNVRRLATIRGFLALDNMNTLIKVAIGRPVTVSNWATIARQLRRKTALRLPENPPDKTTVRTGLAIKNTDGQRVSVRLPILEDALAPTLIVWPERDGVIVPIARNYADDLLGTGKQMPLFGEQEAALVTQRTYFNTTRSASVMRTGTPILFYESKRSGGRGSVVAAARIVDSAIHVKKQLPKNIFRRGVVEEIDPLTSTSEVLATTFDNLLPFPKPVSLQQLRELKAIGSTNLQTATALSNAILSEILEMGWQ